MRDTKSLSLLLLSSVLFLLSIILLCTWGYQYYHQIQEDKTIKSAIVNNASSVNDATRDSLLKIYQLTLNSLDNKADTAYTLADSLKGDLNINLLEFYRLRDEIAVLLQSQTPKTEDLGIARKKITELQQGVELLRFKNLDVAKENKRLKAVIAQLSKTNGGPAASTDNNAVQAYIESNKAKNINAPKGTIAATNLKLTAITIVETAGGSEKLEGSFTVKNNTGFNAWFDVMVVVTQPNGQVLQKSAWESGSFETKTGKKIYSCKIRCETDKGESKQLNFSLSPEKYQKGNYTMQIYHNGVLIGRASKSLA